jgi:hypothetical protein
MNWTKCFVALTLLGLVLPPLADAAQQEGSRAFQIHNRLRVEHDDNVFLTDGDEQDSFKIIEEIELFVNFNLEQTFISLRYRPSFVYWDDRPDDDTDFNHDFDLVFNHSFTPRVSLSIKDTFRLAELPELIDRGTTLRENNDFVYNTLNGTLGVVVNPETRLEAEGRYILLRYDDNAVAEDQDYDLYVGGLTLRHQLVPETAISGEARFETIEYDGADRGSDSIQLGGGIEQIFSPNLIGVARVGYQHKEFNETATSSTDSPYVDASLTFLPSPATRLTAGVGYAMYETDAYPFANQDRFSVFLSLAHELTARLSWFVSIAFLNSELDGDEAIVTDLNGDGVPDVPEDGSEDAVQLSTRLNYRLNRSNSLEAGWQLVDLDSDIRENYTRNRISLGWKTEL